MSRRDIHRVDNYLIRIGWAVLAVTLIATGCSTGSEAPSWSTWFALGAAVVMLGTGKESRTLAVWDILERSTEVSLAELVRSTGYPRETVREALALINAQPDTYYVWDPDSDRIVDGRLRSHVIAVDQCESCGATVNERVALDLAAVPSCRYCRAPVVKRDLNTLKLEAVAAIRAEHAARRRGFSAIVFVLLLFVFWPAAVAYAVWKTGLWDAWVERLRTS